MVGTVAVIKPTLGQRCPNVGLRFVRVEWLLVGIPTLNKRWIKVGEKWMAVSPHVNVVPTLVHGR